MGKVCPHCQIEKDESEFGKNKRLKDGLNYLCKECKRKQDRTWVAKHNEEHKQRARDWRKNNPDKVREQHRKRKEYLLSLKTPCIKCGESRPTVIEFHHVDPKTKLFNLGYVIANGAKPRAMIEAELEKCVCLCANCHAEFHEMYGTNPDKPAKALSEYINL